MAALTADRNTPTRLGIQVRDPVAANAVIYTGALYSLDSSGNAVPATAGGRAARGVAQHRVNNTGGSAGALSLDGERGCWRFGNSAAGAQITRGDIGGVAFVADDQTVSKTGTAVAGTIVDVEDGEVWVDVGTASVTVA